MLCSMEGWVDENGWVDYKKVISSKDDLQRSVKSIADKSMPLQQPLHLLLNAYNVIVLSEVARILSENPGFTGNTSFYRRFK